MTGGATHASLDTQRPAKYHLASFAKKAEFITAVRTSSTLRASL
jgi:hypothetical protein